MTNHEIVENFFGVYLLYCMNPEYKGKTYIGYTRDPVRRITQHNRGKWAGGAYRTSNKGPWKMVLIVHGFPSNIAALRFEWAWQNPERTTRLNHVINIKKMPRKETNYDYQLRILLEMLSVGPWNRLPLYIRWLDEDYFREFPIDKAPPKHMIICQGPVKSKNRKEVQINHTDKHCDLCHKHSISYVLKKCLNIDCDFISHIICMSELFLQPGDYIPIGGECPKCSTFMAWGDFVSILNKR